MCGLTGILSWDKPVSQDILQAGMDALHHRGPDEAGHWISENKQIGLGHRRLSILGVDSGKQPIQNETGRIHIIVNGEFYDHDRIRKELVAKGHQFKTDSDSEIALHLYEDYGFDALKHLRGEFALILWDEDKQLLFAARDRFGIKPLCFTDTAKGLMLASEAKALFAMGVPAAWDHYSYYHSASLQYVPQDKTLFENIQQLKPGHALIAKDKKIEIFKYWDLDYADEDKTLQRPEQDWIKNVQEDLEDAVKLRLRSDVPVCFHLSGGLDSSAVLGLAAKNSDKPLDAFSISFDHDIYDEFEIAQEMANFAGANFHPINVSQDDLVYELPDAVYYGEGLAINGHLAAKHILNKHIRAQGFKVALTGEGADEVFAGYPHLREDIFKQQAQNENQDQLFEKLYATNIASAGVQLAHGAELPTDAVEQVLGFVPSFLNAKAALGNRVNNVLSDSYKQEFVKTDCYADLMQEVDVKQLHGKHHVNQSLYLWTKLTLANYILNTLGDGMEMSQSIEGRLPFLDHKLFETIRNMPLSIKIKDTTEKYVLREAVKPYITDTIYKRQKHPFMAPPISRYSNSKLNTFIQDSLRSDSFKSVPFFDTQKILDMLDKLPTQDEKTRTAAEPVLMMVLTTHIMHQTFKL